MLFGLLYRKVGYSAFCFGYFLLDENQHLTPNISILNISVVVTWWGADDDVAGNGRCYDTAFMSLGRTMTWQETAVFLTSCETARVSWRVWDGGIPDTNEVCNVL